MHQAAFEWVQYVVEKIMPPSSVLEFGSRNVNGTVRGLFPDSDYCGTDVAPGPGVDKVCDAADWRSDRQFDLVITTECLEHTPRGQEICHSAWIALRQGGVLMVTAAAPPRGAHSAIDGGPLRHGEYYGNVTEQDMRYWLRDFSFSLIDVVTNQGDIYALAVK